MEGDGMKTRSRRRETLREQFRAHKALTVVYFLMRLAVLLVLVASILERDYHAVFYCLITLLLFLVPTFVERRIKIEVPDLLHILILLFIFAAQILGEIREYYLTFPYWDAMLHTITGFLAAAIGFAFIDIWNSSEHAAMKLSPLFAAVFAFCFSMTVGVLWEFFECFMDLTFHTDMQKDTVIPAVSSVLLNPEGHNVVVTVPVEELTLGDVTFEGYLDVGLRDTMKDLFVNFLGALVFSVIGFFYVKKRGKSRFLRQIMPRKKTENTERK